MEQKIDELDDVSKNLKKIGNFENWK